MAVATPIGQEHKREEPWGCLRLLLTYSFIILPKKFSLKEPCLKMSVNTMNLQCFDGSIPQTFIVFNKNTFILKINFCTSQRNKPSIHISYDCSDIMVFKWPFLYGLVKLLVL